jgi:hypothetical protein
VRDNETLNKTLSIMSKKFKFQIDNVIYSLPTKYLQHEDWNGEKLDSPQINMNQVATASVIKQYVKHHYPSVFVSSSSSIFSGGNSVSINISTHLGNEVNDEIYRDVTSFANRFQMGSFNGMEDIYEYDPNRDFQTDNGTTLDIGTKWVSVTNRPSFGTVPDIVRMIVEMTTTENYVFGQISIQEAIDRVLDYKIPQSKVNKALSLIG